MRNSSRIGALVLLAALVIVVFGRTWEAHGNRGTPQMAGLTEKMRAVCVGRFLIDMPEEAQVELARARIHGFDISAFIETT